MRHRGSMILVRVLITMLTICSAAQGQISKTPGKLPPFSDVTPRSLAVTIDDLPAAAATNMSGPEVVEMTTKLLATLKQQNVPAVGFVNERKLYYKMDQVNDFIKALSLWVENGLELGNHTFAHTSLNRVPLKEWEDAVIQGEPVTRLLLAQHGMRLRFFRHPYLDTGRDLQTRREAEQFLIERGYHIAPVTLDAWDWHFAGLYDYARHNGDAALQQEIVRAYVAYHSVIFEYYEKLSRELFGYEPKQILLLHGNWLEAEHIGELLDMIRKRGYQFVTLESALGDPAYSMPDEFIGEEGTNWIEHWAITRGRPLQHVPVFPPAIEERIKSMPRPPQPLPISPSIPPY